MKCEYCEVCPMFAQFRMAAALEMWKAQYCEGNEQACFRYQEAKAGREVADDVLPNGKVLRRG